jgi:6-phosphogluconate dehydrogenase
MAHIGLVGLGTMGANLALNIAEKGYEVAVWNREPSRTETVVAGAGELAKNLVPCDTLADLAAAIDPPRAVILMIPAGDPVDEMIVALGPLLGTGDTIIDAGNAISTTPAVGTLRSPARASASSAWASRAARRARATVPRSWSAALPRATRRCAR